jgi:orotidine-5'-phosphate decarboxylase
MDVPMNFADRLIARVREIGHPLCLGLDPHIELIPSVFQSSVTSERPNHDVDLARSFLFAVLERSVGKVPIVKPQSAFFEAMGWPGVKLLSEIIAHCKTLGFIVLLDAKRGDIGSTAQAYASAYLSEAGSLSVDAITVNPYLGVETLDPFTENCKRNGRGMFTLVKTSNPGASQFQDVLVDGKPLYHTVAFALQEVEDLLLGDLGWSSNGVVVGATYPGDAVQVREILPRSIFLIPGYGNQGGAVRDAVRSFVAGPNGLEGGIVSASRSLLFPARLQDDCKVNDWETSFDRGLDRAISELGGALR